MMKRPRSFISSVLIILSLASATLVLTTQARDAHASSMPRLMDPRAGDPDEPSPSVNSPNQESKESLPTEFTSPLLRRPFVFSSLSTCLQKLHGLLLNSISDMKRR